MNDASPLTVLRENIDALDHELLQLLARRGELVAQVAVAKRAAQLPIRDLAREREIIDDRVKLGNARDLSPQFIESIFRLILSASRDSQSVLQAEIPFDFEPKTIAIIGGNGAMGRCMAKLFRELGHTILTVDIDTNLKAVDAAKLADAVLIAVPIDVTERVIFEIGPHVREDALLFDISSIKRGPVDAMIVSTRATVIGTHPLFGPSVHSVQGQRIVLTPAKSDAKHLAWRDWLRQMFEARGLNVLETTAELHDQAMAIVQVLTHFSTEVMGKTLSDFGLPLQETLQFTSPVYLMELLMTARHFAQSPQLYASIQMSNPATAKVLEAFTRAADELKQIVVEKDREAFKKTFDAVRNYFGSFTEQALDQSSYLIDRLIERAEIGS